MPSNHSKSIAVGGVFAALAIVIMCLGGLIPIATYACPMLCTMTQFLVLRICGKRISCAWFAVVVILSLLFSPDKEAAFMFLAIGYYPLIKHPIEHTGMPLLLKLIFFNCSIFLIYSTMIFLLGMQEIASENMELGFIGLAVLLLLGNVTFLLLDKLLAIMDRKMR